MKMKKITNLILMVVLIFSLVVFIGSSSSAYDSEFRTNSNILSDVRVRQAIAYAVDMDTICATLLEGKAIPADSLTPNGDWKVKGLNNYAYNPEKAKKLLKEAGWDPNYVLDVTYYYGDQITVDLMSIMQEELAEVGIKTKYRKLEGDTAAQMYSRAKDPVNGPAVVTWDLAYAACGALVVQEYYNRFVGGASSNSNQPTDKKLDELIAPTNETVDVNEQKAAFYKLQKYFNEKLFAIPLYYQQAFIYESTRVDRKGNTCGNGQYAYDWRIIDWDVKSDKDGKHILYSNRGPFQFFLGPFNDPALQNPQKILFDRLIVADGELSPKKGQLASEYAISKDGKTITFVLREGVTWHDGVPFTAEDVRFTVEYLSKILVLNAVAKETFSSLVGYDDYIKGNSDEISGIVIDGNKVTFKFAKVAPNALLIFSQYQPLPRHLLKGSDPLRAQQDPYWQAPVGTGPFILDEVKMNNYSTYTRYKGYWDKTGTGNIEKIQLYPSEDSDANIVINAEAGKLDYAFSKSVEDEKAIEKMENMKVTPVNIRYTRMFYVNKFPKSK
jgi:peptide/nickel transport system substrate-binding protein